MLDGLNRTGLLVDVSFAPELTDSCTALAFRRPPCQDTERHTHAPAHQGLCKELHVFLYTILSGLLTSIVEKVDGFLQGNLWP